MEKRTITERPVNVRSNTSALIDQLNYTYYSGSNKLKAVTDAVNDNKVHLVILSTMQVVKLGRN
jgi:hypothetical protein